MSSPVSLTKKNNIAIITIDNPPVNALSHAVRLGLLSSISLAEKDPEVKVIIIHCNGRTFIAGADISEFGKAPLEPHLPDVLAKISCCKKPVVAALFGSVLGGGFEVALSCHYRVALTGTKLGLPEVTLGLIPGAGGTQLLPRLAGIELALEMITSGKPKVVDDLLDKGVVDALVDAKNTQSNLLQEAIVFSKTLIEDKKGSRPTSEIEVKLLKNTAEIFNEWRAKLTKKARGQKAPQYCINSIENATKLTYENGIKKEREMFIECRNSSQSRAMRHAFFAERSAAKLSLSTPVKEISTLEINSVAVIGAGTMGGGIAMCFAKAGIAVKLLEMSQDNLTRGITAIEERFTQALKRGLMTQEKLTECIALIQGTCDYSDLANVDLVVEAAFETMEVKKQIFSNLERACKPDTILATNTSYLDINEIALETKRPEKVVGMHFFSPANIMKLLEVVRTKHTDDSTLKTAMDLGKRLGKISVAVNVCYGFVGNRMYACYGREANMLLLEGASPSQIDRAMQTWGMAMGPLAVNDMSGIDIAYKARKDNPQLSEDPLYFCAANTMVESGRLGQKTDAGFYKYDAQTKRRIDDDSVLIAFKKQAETLGVKQRNKITDEEIQQRLIFALINEGANILDEGIAVRASDIDVIWLNGYGFPRYYGGPMCYANEIGLDKVLTIIQGFKQRLGDQYWQPSALIESLVRTNGKFK
ncbi:3-hydroxyacyl-CoA dehydrogenase NAD-binding domain-containing protein [Pseudocolwellia sp. HL-MZ19]|uniref:3-hydroxyacyl-CoA dehydrogenase NAD-binding domain-containing protein n=1 Tax=Pseudocolwellia sp. HL-MZ19 TaxID=3400846 RepID=UPI003CF4CD9F